MDNLKCRICRFRTGVRCSHFERECSIITGCNIHLVHGDWDQTARLKKDKKKEALQRKLEDAKEKG